MRKVFSNNKGVIETWFKQCQEFGRNRSRSLYFKNDTIYSYGEHYPLARLICGDGKRFVLVNCDESTVTTASHRTQLNGFLYDKNVSSLHFSFDALDTILAFTGCSVLDICHIFYAPYLFSTFSLPPLHLSAQGKKDYVLFAPTIWRAKRLSHYEKIWVGIKDKHSGFFEPVGFRFVEEFFGQSSEKKHLFSSRLSRPPLMAPPWLLVYIDKRDFVSALMFLAELEGAREQRNVRLKHPTCNSHWVFSRVKELNGMYFCYGSCYYDPPYPHSKTDKYGRVMLGKDEYRLVVPLNFCAMYDITWLRFAIRARQIFRNGLKEGVVEHVS
ncbi:MAG: hypothetical protein AB1330_01860 [Bacillota bacterium]